MKLGTKVRHLWRVALKHPYPRDMGIAKKHPRIKPVARAKVLDKYPGEWVAVKNGVVVAHARTSREAVLQMRKLGPEAKGAVLQRAASPHDPISVGLG